MEQNNESPFFKVISIRPLGGCNPQFLKHLVPGDMYWFYGGYELHGDVITYEPAIPTDLYYQEGIKIQVSAIAGKNGSGKSTIVELLFAAAFLIAKKEKIFIRKDNSNKRKNWLNKISPSGIRLELFYQIDDVIYQMVVDGEAITSTAYTAYGNSFKKTALHGRELNIRHFFYSVVTNYSQYGLNSELVGDWLTELFHKNDGYQTPIVISPLRTKGNIDINKEDFLVKSRLLANLLTPLAEKQSLNESLRCLTDNKVAHALKLSVNRKKFKYKAKKDIEPIYTYSNRYGKTYLPRVYKAFLNDETFVPDDNLLNRIAKEYIMRKLVTIAEKYITYKDEMINGGFLAIDIYLYNLVEDDSHVTYKLRQAVNFLTNKFFKKDAVEETVEVTVLATYLKTLQQAGDPPLIYLIPPSFFDIEIRFENGSLFEQMSSGEKQKIYSTSSVIYHLLNLQSVNSEKLIKYRHVNILFDEVELYYHPEFQRTFIYDFLKSIKKAGLNGLGINIIFITHSPFILSDIPDDNIMYLEVINNEARQKFKDNKTFGANIIDLLADSFFLNDGLIGKFAKEKIGRLIEKLQPGSELTDIELGGIKQTISLIGEEFLRIKLWELYDERVGLPESYSRIAEIEAELAMLKNRTSNDQSEN